MALNANIILGQEDFRTESPQERQAKQLQLQNAQMQQSEYERKMRQSQQDDDDKVALKGAFESSIEQGEDGQPKLNEKSLLNNLYRTNPQMAIRLAEQFQSRDINNGKLQRSNQEGDLDLKLKQQKYDEGVAKLNGTGGDEDNLIIPTANGLMYFNKKNRKDFGYLDMDGRKVMRSQDDAPLRGQVKESEARATAGYDINTDIDGVVSTDRQVAETANPQLIRPPQGSQFGTPSMRVPPNVQQQRDATRLQVLMGEREPNVYNAELEKEIARMGGARQPKMAGIIVPTKAQQAASEATAKDTVAVQSDKNKAVRKSDQLLANVSQAEQLLKLDPTGSGIGAAMDVAGRMVGLSSSSAKVATQLETLSGWMVANVPRMEGPQSNFDVQNYQTMAAKIGDRTTPVGERKAALKTMKELQLKYKALNSNESNAGPLTLTLPNGKTATFKDKAMMDAYKKYKGIK